MKEYLLHLWGGFFNEENIKIHGYKPGYYFFKTEKEANDFYEKLQKIEDSNKNFQCLAKSIETNKHIRYETHAIMKLKYKDKSYYLDYNFGYGYPRNSAEYMFYEGNYSCDCNKSLFIQNKIDKNFPELECGNEIVIENFIIKYLNFNDKNFVECKD